MYLQRAELAMAISLTSLYWHLYVKGIYCRDIYEYFARHVTLQPLHSFIHD